MISKRDLALALRTKAIEVTTANSYQLVFDGREFTPTTDEPYTKEHPMFGDDNKIGLEDSSSDFQIGIYQLTVFSPREISNLTALTIVDTLVFAFARGTELTENGQMARIMESSVKELNYHPTHIMYAISIKYSVIN